MSNTRFDLIGSISEYMTYGNIPNNSFFAKNRKQELLKAIQQHYSVLSNTDKSEIKKYVDEKMNASFSIAEKHALENFTKHLVKDAAIGTTIGFLTGKLIRGVIFKNHPFSYCLDIINAGIGCFQGVWLGIEKRNPEIDVDRFGNKIRHFSILSRVLSNLDNEKDKKNIHTSEIQITTHHSTIVRSKM